MCAYRRHGVGQVLTRSFSVVHGFRDGGGADESYEEGDAVPSGRHVPLHRFQAARVDSVQRPGGDAGAMLQVLRGQ